MKLLNRNLTILSLLLFLLLFLWNHFLSEKFQSQHAYIIVPYFFISSLLVNKWLAVAERQSPQHFIRTYMASAAIRLLVNLLVIIIYILLFRPLAMNFVLIFMVLYFIYLIFEVVVLMSGKKQQ